MKEYFGKVIFGRLTGAFMMILSLFFWAANYSALQKDYYYPKWLTVASIMTLLGITMIVFPGPGLTLDQWKYNGQEARDLWTLSPWSHRLAWLAAIAIGIVLNIYLEEQIKISLGIPL